MKEFAKGTGKHSGCDKGNQQLNAIKSRGENGTIQIFRHIDHKKNFFCKVEMLFLDEARFFRVYQFSEHVKGWSCSRRFSRCSPAQDSQSWAQIRQRDGAPISMLLFFW